MLEEAVPSVYDGIEAAPGRFRAVEVKSVVIAQVQAQSW
jgi:hypothetical protein